MNVGILLPGFSSDERDAAIPVQLELVRALAAQHDVRVLALRYPFRRARYSVAGAEVLSLGGGLRGSAWRLALWADALMALRNWHHVRRFDVLHAMWADETGLVAVWAGGRLGIPAVVSVLGGELVRLDDIGYGLQRRRFSRWTVRQALRGAQAVVIMGEYARAAVESSGVRPDRIHVAPLGVDTQRFHPPLSPRPPARLLHVGSLTPVKGQVTILRALSRLPASISLDIVGDGPERQRLELFARSLGLAERVRFAGHAAYDDMPGWYQQATVHVMASRSESLPMAVLEAAATALPTVETAVGALANTPVVAATVAVGDDAALAEAIRRLLDDDARRVEAGKTAHAAVKAGYTLEQGVARYVALYKSLIQSG